jgi:hypothetical protein
MVIVANIRGTRYNMSCATVGDVCRNAAEKTGLKQDEQAVLYRGKLLQNADSLSKLGISVGDTLNIVKKRKEALTQGAARGEGGALPNTRGKHKL